MKSFIYAAALTCAVCAFGYAEEDIKGKLSDPAKETVVIQEAGGSGDREIASGAPRRSQYPNDGGVDDSGAMQPFETYDENTGMRNYVPSDSYGEVDE